MKITLEMINELKEQKNVSYSEAKEALEQTEGDLIEAIILLEKSSTDQMKENQSKSISDNIKNSFDKKIPSFLVIIISMILLSFLIIGVMTNISDFIPFLIKF